MDNLPQLIAYERIAAAKRNLERHRRLIFWALLLAIVALGVAQTIPRLEHSVSVDEPYTANVIQASLPEMFALLRTDTSPPLHYLALKIWVSIFGESEVALRLPSVLFFGGTILVMGLIGRKLAGFQAGLLAALLVALSTRMGIPHAATARMYAQLGFIIALASWLHLRALGLLPPKPTTRRFYALLIVVNLIGLFTHPIFAFVMGGFTLSGLVFTDLKRTLPLNPLPANGEGTFETTPDMMTGDEGKNRSRRIIRATRPFLTFVLTTAISIGLYVVIGLPLYSGGVGFAPLNWLPRPEWHELDLAFTEMLWGTGNTRLLALLCAGIVLFYVRRGVNTLLSRPALVGIIVVVATMLTPFLLDRYLDIGVFFRWRTPIIMLPMIALTVALFLSRAGTPHLTLILVGLLLNNALSFSFSPMYDTHLRDELAQVAPDIDCATILVYGSLSITEVEYYLRRANVPDCQLRETFPLSTAEHPGWMDSLDLYYNLDELDAEALETVERYANTEAARVWFFYEEGGVIGDINDSLKNELDMRFTLSETIDSVSGWNFDAILVYAID